MKRMKTFSLAALACMSVFVSCNKNSDDTKVISQNQQDAPVAFRTMLTGTDPGGLITWEEAYIHADEIKFGAKRLNGKGNHGGDHVEYKTKIDQRIDLFLPDPAGHVRIPAGIYENINFKIGLEPESPYHAMFISGRYADDGNLVPLHIILDEELTLKDEIKGPINVASGQDYLSLLSLNLARLVAGIDAPMLEQADRSADGVIRISRQHNQQLYDRIINNLSDVVKVKFE